MSEPNANDRSLQNEALLRQLSELNARSRWYSSQLWQTPFAYLAVCGIIMSAGGRNLSVSPFLIIFCATCGVFLRFHLRAVRDAQWRSIENLIATEHKLGLEQSARHGEGPSSPTSKSTPLMYMIDFLIVSFFIIGVSLVINVQLYNSLATPVEQQAAP